MNDSSTLGVGLAGIILGTTTFLLIIILAVVVFSVIVMWKMFEKAGKEGWRAIVPVYNVITLFEIAGLKWYYIFIYCLSFIPVIGGLASLFFNFVIMVKVSKSFGKDVGFGVGLTLLNLIFMAILAFDKSITYTGPTCNGDLDFNNLF